MRYLQNGLALVSDVLCELLAWIFEEEGGRLSSILMDLLALTLSATPLTLRANAVLPGVVVIVAAVAAVARVVHMNSIGGKNGHLFAF